LPRRFENSPSESSHLRSRRKELKLKTFIITASAGANGSIIPSGRVKAIYGGSQKFSFKPNKGYGIGQIQVDGISVGKLEVLLFGNIMSSHKINLIFIPLR